jgi:uncharacterized protein
MLLVKTKLGQSQIEGVGLFADQFIPKGTAIWQFTPGIDIACTEEEWETMKQDGRAESVERYVYKSLLTNRYILCGDDARFFNHSKSPTADDLDTTGSEEGTTRAIKDIYPGDEITSDYELFDAEYITYAFSYQHAPTNKESVKV